MSFFSIFRKTDNEEYFKSLNKIKTNSEYQNNKKQIEYITKILVDHADVPRDIIESLIECVQENVAIEYENSSKYWYK